MIKSHSPVPFGFTYVLLFAALIRSILLKMVMGIVLIFTGLAAPLLAETQTITVKYVSAEYIYISAGQAEGIRKQDSLKVIKDGKSIGLIEAVYTASHSSSCKIISQTKPMLSGYKVVLLTQRSNTQTPEAFTRISRKRPVKTKESVSVSVPVRISGYAALQGYRFIDGSNSDNDQNLPSFHFKILAKNLFSPHMRFRLRFRSLYNAKGRSLPDLRRQNRLYEASLTYDNPKAIVYAKMGRIISSGFSGIGYMDGFLMGQRINSKWHWGIFAGTQPQWQYSDFQTSYQKYGSFVRFRQANNNSQRIEINLYAAAVYHKRTVSREFLFQRLTYNKRNKWNIYQSLEIDINRNWRRQRIPKTVNVTGLYLSGHYIVSPWLSAGINYDNRKNYYTYETRGMADSLFDDAQRQGLRGNIQIHFLQDYRLSAYIGIRKKANENKMTYAYGSTLRKQNFLLKHMYVFGRINGFDSFFISGINPSARLGFRFKQGHSIDITYGAYLYTLKTTQTAFANQWLRLNTRVTLPLRFYIGGYYQYDWGDTILGHRIFTDIGYYF